MKKSLVVVFVLCSTILSYAAPLKRTLVCDNGWQKYAMSVGSTKFYEAYSRDNVSDKDITNEAYENTEAVVSYDKSIKVFSVDNRMGGVPLTMKTVQLMKGNVIVLNITNEDDKSIVSVPCYWRNQNL